MALKAITVSTNSYNDQKPGTSGLRKPVKTFLEKKNYTENFIQSILNSIENSSILICGGDGRFYMKEAINIIVKIAAANNVDKLYIGQNGILSTPSVSSIILTLNASGGIILTASHNPGGLNGDFGIKFNSKNGGPADETLIDKIYENSKSIKEFKICPNINVDLEKTGKTEYILENGKKFVIEIIDSIEIYLNMMKNIFDFNEIKNFLKNNNFKIIIDSMNGVMGPYTKKVFVHEFGLKEDCLRRYIPLEDFGNKHPDPNLTYANELIEEMKTGKYNFGAAFDGDGDRNMILGKYAFFVTPSDSLALIAANLDLIPYFKNNITGFARSMPTAPAIDQVAKKKNLNCYEVPTGWKFFGNLIDEKKICLCGEESFGIGSNHIREKDGLWAVLCWLLILAKKSKINNDISVETLIKNHWTEFGRNFFTRYDFENCILENCYKMMKYLNELVENESLIGKTFKKKIHYLNDIEQEYKIVGMDNFQYLDPINHILTTNQGIRIFFNDKSRIIVRLSGTGSQGAAIRLYIDTYITEKSLILKSSSEILKPLLEIALSITEIYKYSGLDKPTVIT